MEAAVEGWGGGVLEIVGLGGVGCHRANGCDWMEACSRISVR